MTSLRLLWDIVSPGGYYFIEDLQVQYAYQKDKYKHAVLDYIRMWNTMLLVGRTKKGGKPTEYPDVIAQQLQQNPEFKILPGVKWILCQNEACVIAKCDVDDTEHCLY